MTSWRPAQKIVVKALALIRREDAVLAVEITNDDGTVKGVRPLGGGVEFGERWQDALTQEFMEELGAEIHVSGDPVVLENIYAHHGDRGHEIVFLSEARFADEALYDQAVFEFLESDETSATARWFSLADLDASRLDLYPTGLKEYLEREEGSRSLKFPG
ncbi:NUDIX domain-containing protein [Roseibium polysiphoniae]|uniref:NUDIX domain-containing protein n=1 Tax=Roseibium polysiphoniae TaxID=2571221 RepID=A0A944CI75_9HYPH|nr:NUDIX domain-containing protein [Roseibium polysiphoniae]MBS8262741.1 NUDIX domain-containing protein [Roseibium polysiphoniae]